MGANGRGIDTGTAYGLKRSTYKANLVEVGPGTPMGELMRRYWQPFFPSSLLTSDRPRRVRLLGEELILFRDKQGRAGLMHEHCCHRGASLFYGRVEEDGIRCCYHGWKFDPQGHCLVQPAEVDGGRTRNKFRQPWYPVEERYGLIYAYMGPPEKKPLLTRWKQFEDVTPDERIEVRWWAGFGGQKIPGYDLQPLDFNWLQAFEQPMDGVHLPWLHFHHSGDQFTGVKLTEGSNGELPLYARIDGIAREIVAERTALGVSQGFPMPGLDGRMYFGCNEAIVPNIAVIPGFIDMLYVVPMDNTHCIMFMLWRSKKDQQRSGLTEWHDGRTWEDLTEEEHQLSPGDYEAQSSIGVVPCHSNEHLSPGDVAVIMLRRRLEEAVEDVAAGRDPVRVSFDPDAPPLETVACAMRPMDGTKPSAPERETIAAEKKHEVA
jgi:phenylpropionate dioxygenase-like ring-hydroxylating dioxygenase large terminal subunit